MVIPAAPHPYLSQLFSDAFLSMGMNWYSFCIENNGFSKEHSLPFKIEVKLESMDEFETIHFGETRCFPVLGEDVFYDVVSTGFVIPDREWVDEHFEYRDGSALISFAIDEVVNFEVYRKFSLSAIVTVYILLVAGVFAILKLLLSIYGFLFSKHQGT